MNSYFQDPKDQAAWNKFVQTYTLDKNKQDKFKKYLDGWSIALAYPSLGSVATIKLKILKMKSNISVGVFSGQ